MIHRLSGFQVPFAYHNFFISSPFPYTHLPLYLDALKGEIKLPSKTQKKAPAPMANMDLPQAVHHIPAVLLLPFLPVSEEGERVLHTWEEKIKDYPMVALHLFVEAIPGWQLSPRINLFVNALPFLWENPEFPPPHPSQTLFCIPLFPGGENRLLMLMETLHCLSPTSPWVPLPVSFQPRALQTLLSLCPDLDEEKVLASFSQPDLWEGRLLTLFLQETHRLTHPLLPIPALADPSWKEHLAWIYRLTFLHYILHIFNHLADAMKLFPLIRQLEASPHPLSILRETGNLKLLPHGEIFQDPTQPIHPIETWLTPQDMGLWRSQSQDT